MIVPVACAVFHLFRQFHVHETWGCPQTFRAPPVSNLTVRRFLTVASLLLLGVVLLLTSVGQPLPLPMPPPPDRDELSRVIAAARGELDFEPADSLFSSLSFPEPEPYTLAVRDALLPPREYRKCQLVAVPSFRPQWAIYLLRKDGSAPQLVSRRMSEHVWRAMRNQLERSWSSGRAAQTAALEHLKIEVETSQAVITVATADLLEEVWSRMLERVRYPRTPWEGEDGVRYHASHWSEGNVKSGQTWSPPQGSRPYALVKLAEQMHSFTETPSSDAEEKLRTSARTLLSRLK